MFFANPASTAPAAAEKKIKVCWLRNLSLWKSISGVYPVMNSVMCIVRELDYEGCIFFLHLHMSYLHIKDRLHIFAIIIVCFSPLTSLSL